MKTILFYPTSPVHISNFKFTIKHLPNWRPITIINKHLTHISPGLFREIEDSSLINEIEELSSDLSKKVSLILIGAIFEPLAIDLIYWAKKHRIPTASIEEVNQLTANQLSINNYDAPFDKLFVASKTEYDLFLKQGYTQSMLYISGLLANDSETNTINPNKALKKINLIKDKPIITYTTSPLRTRLCIHNKDDWYFRQSILRELNNTAQLINAHILVKLHPNENLKKESERIYKTLPNAIIICSEIDINETLAISDIVINRGNSQTALQSALLGIPTIILAIGIKTLFHTDGGTYIVEDIKSLTKTIELALKNETPSIETLKNKHYYRPISGTGKLIAIELEKLAKKTYTDSASTWEWLIKCYMFFGLLDKAYLVCNTSPYETQWIMRVRNALASSLQGKQIEAIHYWKQCIELDQHWYAPHFELAYLNLAQGNFNQAIFEANEAIRLHPPFHYLWHSIPMQVLISRSYRLMGYIEQAQQELKKLHKQGLTKLMPEIMLEEAELYLALNNQRLASHTLNCAYNTIKTYPIRPDADQALLEHLAAICTKIKDPNIGLNLLSKLINDNNKNSALYKHLTTIIKTHPLLSFIIIPLLLKSKNLATLLKLCLSNNRITNSLSKK